MNSTGPVAGPVRRLGPPVVLGLVVAAAHLAVGGWMLVTRWDVLTAAHPALLILVAAILVLGLLHAALAVRRLRTPGPRNGGRG